MNSFFFKPKYFLPRFAFVVATNFDCIRLLFIISESFLNTPIFSVDSLHASVQIVAFDFLELILSYIKEYFF
jgi:hypothetical protein